MPKLIDITALLTLLFLPLIPRTAHGGDYPSGDGKISLFNYHENEYLDVKYKDGKRYLTDGIDKIESIFRSRDGKKHPIDLELVELVDHLEDHFAAETIEIISGYRSPEYNRSLRFQGRGATSESLHTKGMACDIHIDEIAEEDVFEYVKSLGVGGAGYYPRYAFVHIDVGPVRTWTEEAPTKRFLIGTENNPNPMWSVVTDKNIYSRGDTLKAAVTNNDYAKRGFSTKGVWIERFQKGSWSDHKKIKVKGGGKRLNTSDSTDIGWTIPEDLPFGKYRLIIFTNKDRKTPPCYSNEFYIKKDSNKVEAH